MLLKEELFDKAQRNGDFFFFFFLTILERLSNFWALSIYVYKNNQGLLKGPVRSKCSFPKM